MRPKIWAFLILFLLPSLVFAQTGEDPNTGVGQPTQAEEEDDKPISFSSIASYLAPFNYEGDRLRNPFVPPELAIPLKPGRVYGPFLPLQQFDLADLKVNGLFWNTSKPKAIIATPDGKTYGIGIKDYIGENFGYVASIREKEMVIIQTISEGDQKFSTTKVMFLATGNKRRSQ
ncbi:MAG: pilus assembly protein PilP [Bdellovibrionales bacterium]|nr:pilus assembly protein PilP [Bdellovibrionales bacterium]